MNHRHIACQRVGSYEHLQAQRNRVLVCYETQLDMTAGGETTSRSADLTNLSDHLKLALFLPIAPFFFPFFFFILFFFLICHTTGLGGVKFPTLAQLSKHKESRALVVMRMKVTLEVM